MTIRQGVMLLALLALGGCSCHRDPDRQVDTAPVATDEPSSINEPAKTEITPQELAALQARDAAFSAAASTVHRYLAALPGRPAEADAMWTGGRPAPLPDDANLRSLAGLQSLRIQSDPPVALDDLSPPEAVEVPVRLVAQTDDGSQRYKGWYRLRPRVDRSGWEITSASLQPALD